MNKIIKSSLYGSLIITLLYLVLFYPLILIHKFDWYDLLLVSLSISPGILIMIFIYNLDEHDKEPLWLLALCFIFGAINLHLDVDILEFIFQFINMDNIFLQLGGEALTVAITEELLKFIVVILIIYPNKAFDEPFDGIVYSVFVGMGFPTAENLTFVMQGNTSVALFRMLSAIPAHFVFAVVMGYYLGIAKSRRKKEFFYISLSIIAPIILHAVYDYFLYLDFVPGLWVGGIVTLIISLFFAKNAIIEHLESNKTTKF